MHYSEILQSVLFEVLEIGIHSPFDEHSGSCRM